MSLNIWTFWDTGEEQAPHLVRACLNGLRRLNLDATVRCLSDATFAAFTHPRQPPPGFHRLGSAHRSDWIRLTLLLTHGGVWLDASIVPIRPVAECFELAGAAEAPSPSWDLEGFAFPGTQNHCQDDRLVLMENWAMACRRPPPCTTTTGHGGSGNDAVFLRAWLEEVERMIEEGMDEYCERLLAGPRRDALHPVLLEPGRLPYMGTFAAWCVAMDDCRRQGDLPRLRLLPSASERAPAGWGKKDTIRPCIVLPVCRAARPVPPPPRTRRRPVRHPPPVQLGQPPGDACPGG